MENMPTVYDGTAHRGEFAAMKKLSRREIHQQDQRSLITGAAGLHKRQGLQGTRAAGK